MNWTLIGAVLAFIAVGAGAFASHGLKGRLEPHMLEAFEVGVRYQMYHALALLALSARFSHANTAAWCFFVGTLLFSGSLYALALTGVKAFGPVTPIGGLTLLAGWALLAYSAINNA